MKKSTSLLLSGILVSGMVLGTVVTPATVVNAEEATTTETKDTTPANPTVTNMIKVEDENGNDIDGFTELLPVQGEETTSINQAIVDAMEKKYPESKVKYVVDSSQKAVFLKDGSQQKVKVYDAENQVSGKVSYVDAATNSAVAGLSSSVEGYVGQKVSVKTPTEVQADSEYTLSDDKATVTLLKGVETYTVYVTKNVSNKIIFKTADGTEVPSKKSSVTGQKVGDTVDVTSLIPDGYTTDNSSITLQSNGNTQIVTVKKTTDGITPFKGVVTIASNKNYAPLYTSKGEVGTRALIKGSEWQTNNKMILKGVTYYQVSTTEWLKAEDISNIKASTDTNTDNSGVQKADRSTVTTIDGNIIFLYTKDGELITTRGLGGNTSWKTDQMITVKGEKMYRVATNEWLKVSELK